MRGPTLPTKTFSSSILLH